MQFTRTQIIFLAVAGLLLLLVLLIVFGVLPGRKEGTVTATLTIWGVDDSRVWRDIIRDYEDTHRNVALEYKEVSPGTYEDELVGAMAAGAGPDIFMFDNNWLLKHKDKITPVSEEKISLATFRGLFPQTAEQDLVFGQRIYALPLSVDTLALIYNRTLFDQNQVVFPPATWAEVEGVISSLKILDESGLERAGAALGTADENMPHAADLLSLMMVQQGVSVLDIQQNKALFDTKAGGEVLEFYASFANPNSSRYTWSSSFEDANTALVKGEVAMVFGYAKDFGDIKSRSPFINVAVAPMPQFDADNIINFPDYWALAVSASSGYPDAAWDFVIYATTEQGSALEYLGATDRPPALRFLIKDYLDDSRIGVFASQALTARSWQQPDKDAFDDIFNSAVTAVVSGDLTPRQALSKAEAEVENLLRLR